MKQYLLEKGLAANCQLLEGLPVCTEARSPGQSLSWEEEMLDVTS